MKPEMQPIRVAITGPESTGKTTLAQQLAQQLSGRLVPEYARTYIGQLGRHYTFEDVEHIARIQVDEYDRACATHQKFVFFDTWLIITKVWFQWVFGRVPDWLEEKIRCCPIDLFLLCKPDLPWEADPVRENGGENRLRLYNAYREELINRNFPFVEIEGTNDVRLTNALKALEKYLHT
jgi:NadR type nicotinamide-nucleotide adenylyltransferase